MLPKQRNMVSTHNLKSIGQLDLYNMKDEKIFEKANETVAKSANYLIPKYQYDTAL
jgi:hypothetical protein